MHDILEAIKLLRAELVNLTPGTKEKLEMVGIDCAASALKLEEAITGLKKLMPEASSSCRN